jgi:hypothetical protein
MGNNPGHENGEATVRKPEGVVSVKAMMEEHWKNPMFISGNID